jgi:glycosyltransferase involved in cell wall biosynthesis
MARPKVLVLTTTFPARPDDATPRFVLELSEAMSDDYDFTVLAPRVKGSVARARVGRLDVVRFPYFPQRWEGVADGATLPNLHAEPWRAIEMPSLMTRFMTRSWSLAKEVRPDLVHAHWLLPCGVFAATLQSRKDIPFVVAAHGVDLHAMAREPLESVRRWVIKRASGIGTDSQELADRADELGANPKAVAIPMGVNVAAMRAAVGERAPVAGRFLFVGRLAGKKGVDVLLRAIAEVPDASLRIAGDGPDRAALEALARELALGERAQFLGAQGRDDVVAQLREAYALVIPSVVAADGDREGTPVVLSEGIAAGVPVIASRLAGIAERVTDGVHAQLVEPSSVGELTKALRWSLEHPKELTRMAKEASATGLRGITLDDAAAGYKQLFEEALRRG